MSLDLEQGEEELANLSPAARRRAARKGAAEAKQQAKKPSSRARSSSSGLETEISSRLHRVGNRIAEMLSTRGDDELAQAIRDDTDAMSQGLVSLTSNVKFLRGPLLMVLNLIEPSLAFGRVGRILYVRFVNRQARIASEREQAAQETAQPSPGLATP